MKVIVDDTQCSGAGECVRECPEVFQFREGSKKAKVIRVPVPAEYEDACLHAAEKCPSQAIRVIGPAPMP